MTSVTVSWLKVVAIIAWCGLEAAPAFSQDYSLDLWRHKDGLPSNTINSLAQSPDGYLWLGTADGLVRYDGYEFITMGMAQFHLRPLGQVRALLVTKNGALLAGGESGAVLQLQNGVAESQLFSSPISVLKALPLGGVLVHTADAQFGCFQDTQPGSHAPLKCVEDTSSGKVPQELTEGGSRKPGPGFGEIRAEVQRLFTAISPHSEVCKILAARNGDLWVSIKNRGLFVVRNKRIVKHFASATGLSDDRILDLLEDRDASIWVATQNGLNRIRENSFTTWSAQDFFKGGILRDIASGRDKRLWIAASTGLWTLVADRRPSQVWRKNVRALQPDSKGGVTFLADNRLQILSSSMLRRRIDAETGQQSLIAASIDGLLWSYSRKLGLRSYGSLGEFRRLAPLPLRAGQTVSSLAAGIGRQVWVGISDGSLLLHDDRGNHWMPLEQGMQVEKISYLSPQANGTLWIATDAGLRFFDGQRFLRWDKTSGLLGDRLLWALPDRLGRLWIAYTFGLAAVSVDELNRQAKGIIPQVICELYDDSDGLENNPEIHGQTPAALTDDGRLWMTIREGLTMIDPARVTAALPPLTHILKVNVDGVDVPLGRRMQFRPLTRTVTVTYTAVSLSAPRKVRYRYRLDGFDELWQEAAASRMAIYTNLRPGSYRFRVASSNGEGWTESEACFSFQVLPAFYQTLWFQVLSSILLLGVLVVLYRYRLRRNEGRLRVRYEDRIAERNQIALDLHDNLIQEMMGVSLQLEIADAITPEAAGAKKPIGRALELAQKVVAEGRATLGTLRRKPLVLVELRATLEDTAKIAETARSVQIIFSNKGSEQPFAPEASDDILHIAREALRNAIYHSGSDTVQIQTEFSHHQFSVVVRDRGQGIDAEHLQTVRAGHFGILGMRERANRMGASLELHTELGSGTEWRLNIPGKVAYQDNKSSLTSRVTIALKECLSLCKNKP